MTVSKIIPENLRLPPAKRPYTYGQMTNHKFSALILSVSTCALIAGCGGGSNGSTGGGGGGGNNAPTITSISPTSVPAGSASFTLTVNGTGFISTTTIQVGTVDEQTSYVSSTQVTASVPAAQVVSGGQLAVIALNGTSSSGSGTPINLSVDNPAPTITQVSPSSLLAGNPSATLTVTGTGFVPTTAIDVNGAARATTYTSSTQVSVALNASDIASSGNLSITAVNSAPGGGTSSATTVAVTNPFPIIGQVSPDYALASATTPMVTLTGAGFVSNSVAQLNGVSMTTTFVSSTQLNFSVPAQSTSQIETLTVVNPSPGGGTSQGYNFWVLASQPAPVITQISPTQLVVGSGPTEITVTGSNLVEQVENYQYFTTGTVLWNGTPLVTSGYPFGNSQVLYAQVPANLLTASGTATITVNSITSNPASSNSVNLPIVNPPPPTLTSIYPAGGPINTSTQVSLDGTGFESGSTVQLNGVTVPSQYVNSTELTTTIPASAVMTPGNVNVTVTTPAPGGGTTSPMAFTAYVSLTSNNMIYNPSDGLLYASVPGSVPGMGNSVVGVDPVTGNIPRQIWVGSNPNKLALSTDGTQLFVGLDGAASVAQVNLSTGEVVNQFSVGGGEGIYNPPFTALYLAAVPGSPNSVAVVANGSVYGGSGVTIYDSGVARANTSDSLGYGSGPLCFGSTATALYLWGPSGLVQLTVGPTGITAGSVLNSTSNDYYNTANIQYDKGSIYLSDGEVLNATTGALLGTFYSSASTAANGPVVSDSTLGLAFIAGGGTLNGGSQVLAFSESSFDPTGNITFYGMNSGAAEAIVRWGQDGVAVSSGTQIFIFQSPLVKNLSTTPADLAVSLSAPQTATTGSAISYVATVNNNGPNAAEGATLALTLDSSMIVNSVTPSQGTCVSSSSFTCDLGDLADGASATVTVSVTPTTAGTFAGTAVVSSVSYDPTTTNNQSTASTTVTGTYYAMAPTVSSISPSFVQAGSGAFTLTLNGSGFNSDSTVNIGGTAVATSYVSGTQLTANVGASAIANYGWAPITVTNPSPGGGTSAVTPLTIYAVVNVPANAIVFDPFSQNIYASVPSAATTLTGNSIVAINPYTAAVGTPIPIGSEPNPMAETSDGNYLFVGLTGSDSLAKFDLIHQVVTATIPLTFTQYETTSNVAASYLAAMPGTDSTVAMNFTNTWGNFGIFDISGNTGSFRPNLSGIYEGVDPVFASPTEVYAYDSQTSGAEFYRYSVNSSGLTLIDGTTLDGMGGFQGGFNLAGGLVYGGDGGIANPSTTPPSQVATLSLPEFYQTGITEWGVGAVGDPSIQQDFVMLENSAGTWEYGLASFSTTTYLPETTLIMPAAASGVESQWTMERFGQDGLALLSNDSFGVSPPVVQLILLRGPFVTPQELSTTSAATLTSSSSSSITHGSGNAILTITGTSLAPGVAVTWNGSYRTTTWVSPTEATVAIPASDLASAGSASLVATNPGAPASNALTITIN